MRLFIVLAVLSQVAYPLYTFHLNEDYNTSQGLQNVTAWGTMSLVSGVNLSEQQPTTDLRTPLKWLLTVDDEGEQNLGLAAPNDPIGPTNSTPIFEGDGLYSNYSWVIEGGCAIELPLSLNSIENGQQDSGDCLAVLGPGCVSTLLSSAYETGNANDWQDYDAVCSAVTEQLQNVVLEPEGPCQRYFDGANKDNYRGFAGTLVSASSAIKDNMFNATSPVLPGHQVMPLWSGKYDFSNVDSAAGLKSTDFNNSIDAVRAMILMFQPPNTNFSFAAYMNCVKVDHLAGNATIARVLPRGTPVPDEPTGSSIQSHRTAGIATGAAFGSLSVFGALAYCFLRYRQKRRDERLRIRDLEQRLAATKRDISFDGAFDKDKAMLDGAELNEMDASPPDPLPLVGTARSEMVGSLGFKELEDSSRTELYGCDAGKELEAGRNSVEYIEEVIDEQTFAHDVQKETKVGIHTAELPGDMDFLPTKPRSQSRINEGRDA